MSLRITTLALLLPLACGPGSSDESMTGGSSSAAAATTTSTTDASASGSGPSTTGGQTSEAGESSGDPPTDVSCEGATAILQEDGTPSGLETCDDGVVHRASAPTCVVPEPPAMCEAKSGNGSCTTSADCTDAPHGACVDDLVADPALAEGCHCEYACETDVDCSDGQVCACAGAVGSRPQCIAAACTVDADCEGLCAMDQSIGSCGGSTFSLACLDPSSECRPGSCPEILDCNEEMMISPPCVIAGGQWVCEPVECFTSCG